MPQAEKYAHIEDLKGRMVDLEALRQEIKHMDRHSLIYRVLKEELSSRGHWKLKDRGISAEKMVTIKASKQYGNVESDW